MKPWPVAMLMIVGLAGCTDDPATPAAGVDPCVVESADDYSCLERDANKTADQVAHVHDYWTGQETIRFLEEERYTGDSVLSSCDAIPVEQFLPADGATVLQGTGQVDIQMEASYRPNHASGPLELWVKRADQSAPEFVAAVEDNFVSLEIAQNASDLPHQVLSAWEFWIYAHPDPRADPVHCAVLARADVTLSVDIHKTLEIVPFPGHPDHWGNETELPVQDAFAAINIASDLIGMCTTSGPGSHGDGSCFMHKNGFGTSDKAIVPPGATGLRLTLTLDRDAEDLGGDMVLDYHGADTREWTRATASGSGDVMEFDIPVEDNHDGPYAEQSQWRFRVRPDSTHDSWQGDWTLTGTVYRTA